MHPHKTNMTPESAILRQITDWLDVKHIWFMRIQPHNGPTQSGRWMRCAQVGCADLLASPGGRMLWIEVKAPKGRQTQAQKEFQETVTRHGHGYVVARSYEDVESFLNASLHGPQTHLESGRTR